MRPHLSSHILPPKGLSTWPWSGWGDLPVSPAWSTVSSHISCHCLLFLYWLSESHLQVRQHLHQQKHKSDFLAALPSKHGHSDSPAPWHVLSTPVLQALGMKGVNTEGYPVCSGYILRGSTKEAIKNKTKQKTHKYTSAPEAPKEESGARRWKSWVCYCINFISKFSSFVEV